MLIVVVGVAAAVADQASKAWAVDALDRGGIIELIPRVLRLRLVLNEGSAFGLLPFKTIFITIASLVLLVVVVIWSVRHGAPSAPAGLILGGGAGNLIDRFARHPYRGSGHVVDFIDLSFWPTFNIADVAIVTGVGLMILLSRSDPEQDQPVG